MRTKLIECRDAHVGDFVHELRRSDHSTIELNLPITKVDDIVGSDGRTFCLIHFGNISSDPWFLLDMSAQLLIRDSTPICRKTYPHVCPRCGEPAYVGFSTVDCLIGCQ